MQFNHYFLAHSGHDGQSHCKMPIPMVALVAIVVYETIFCYTVLIYLIKAGVTRNQHYLCKLI